MMWRGIIAAGLLAFGLTQASTQSFYIPIPGAASLAPGSGWSGPISQPPVQGSSGATGYGDNAIGIWDTVPFQSCWKRKQTTY